MDTRGHKAFTLAELVLAISITAIIGLAVATLAVALSHAQGHSDVMTGSIQSARTAMLNTEATIRKAKLIGAVVNGDIVTWGGDANGSGGINLNELTLIYYRSGERTIERWQVVFPDGMSPETLALLNVSRTLAEIGDPDDVRNLMSGVLYTDYLATRILATDVEGFDVVTDESPPFARLVVLRVTVGPVDQRIQLPNTVRLRFDAVDCVEMVEGVPVLNLD